MKIQEKNLNGLKTLSEIWKRLEKLVSLFLMFHLEVMLAYINGLLDTELFLTDSSTLSDSLFMGMFITSILEQ